MARRGATLLLAVPVVAASAALAALEHGSAMALRNAESDVDAHVTIPAPAAARFMSLGHSELAADLVWIKSLIYYGDGLVHHTGMPDVEVLVRLVNALDPYFRKPYLWGAYATTFRSPVPNQAEYQASVDVLRRALAIFPDDWEFNWLLGLRLHYDLAGGTPDEIELRKDEGAALIERAMHSREAPHDLVLLATTMRTKLGQKERALRELREMILNTDDEKARAPLQRRYAALASDMASNELAAEVRRFDAAWQAEIPYAPRTFYVLVGPHPSPAFDVQALARSPAFAAGTDVAEDPGR